MVTVVKLQFYGLMVPVQLIESYTCSKKAGGSPFN